MTVRQFPIYTQVRWFNNGVINNEQDLDLCVKDEQMTPLDYVAFINHAPYIYTTEVQVTLQRYNMLKDYSVPSYSNNFDGLPATWVDTLGYITHELNQAKEAFQKVKQNG